MSWCDKLASTPTAGFKLEPMPVGSDRILQAFSPILAECMDGDRPTFAVEGLEPFGVNVNTEAGYRYAVDLTRISVQFNHRVRVVPVSGGAPTMQMLSSPRPYDELLSDSISRLIHASLLLKGQSNRQLKRFGIVSTTMVSEDDLPPGILRMIEYFGRPWSGDISDYNFSITSTIKKTAKWIDKCTHILNKPPLESQIQMMTLNFDWHREFATPQPLNESYLKEMTGSAKKSAISYFESLAEGERFDEQLIAHG